MLEKIPTTENYYYVAIIAILTFVLTMVTSKGGLTNHRFRRRWWKKYTKRGWQAISLGLLIILFLFLQDINNRNLTNFNESRLVKERNSRDSTITTGINDGVKKSTEILFNNLSLAFKNQGLQFDTINNQIVTLKDTIRKSKGIIIPPILRLRKLDLIDTIDVINNYKFLYEIISDDASCYYTNVVFDIFGFTPEGYIKAIDFNKNLLYKGQTIGKDQSLTGYLITKVNFPIATYVFRLKGFYYSSDKSKINIDNLYLLRTINNKTFFETPAQFHDNAIREYIKTNNF